MDEKMKKQIEHTLNTELSGLSTSSLQRDRLYQNAIRGERMKTESHFTFHPSRKLAILLALMMALTCVAAAAFYPQIISWFANQYGDHWVTKLEDGSVALPNSSVEVNGAVYTIDEVLVRDHGLYVLGHIKPQPGHILVEQECTIDEPFGYNIHYGEIAPDGTPTIAEKAEAEGAIVHYVGCFLDGISVDQGTVLAPDCWGYGAMVTKGGNITFSMEVEDVLVVTPGKEYTLVLSANSYGVKEDGSIDHENLTTKTWSFTVIPELLQQK